MSKEKKGLRLFAAPLTHFLLGVALIGCDAAEAAPLPTSGTLVQSKGNDGDTVSMQTASGIERIRLTDLDAPETSHGRNKPGQPFSQAARKHLANFLGNKTVQLECYERDRYGRPVCGLFVDGINVNLMMIHDGYAWPAEKSEYIRYAMTYTATHIAKTARRGLWQQAKPVPPWEWRKICWAHGLCEDQQSSNHED